MRYSDDREKIAAFLATLSELYERHPIPDGPNATALRSRRKQADYAAANGDLETAVVWAAGSGVPYDELRTIEQLIFG